MIYLTPLTTTTPEERRREIGRNRYHRINHHRINRFRASNRKPKRSKVSCFKQKTPNSKEQREKREQREEERKIFRGEREIFVLQTENPKEQREKRKERAEKRRERKIFGRNERRERNFRNKYQLVRWGQTRKILIF